MRYLVFSDVHANLEALHAVVADAGRAGFQAAIFLGDLVGYGPNPNECADLILGLPTSVTLVGNHDLAALGKLDLNAFNPLAKSAALWTSREMRLDIRAYLESLRPAFHQDEFDCAHASPRDPVWEYLEEEYQGPPNFAAFRSPLCFVGHTHQVRVFEQSSPGHAPQVRILQPSAGTSMKLNDGIRRIVNPGGVGQPRDGDPRAAYGIWDTGRGTFEYRRVPYAVDTTQRKIRDAGLPPYLAERLSMGV